MTALAKPPHEVFAQVYVTNGYNSRNAALVSGLNPSAVNHPKIAARIRELMEQQFAHLHVDAERVKRRLAQVAFQDIRDLYDDQGNLIPPHLLSDDAAATIAGIDVEIKGGTTNAQGVTSPIVETRKIRRTDQMAALNILAKHFKIIGDSEDQLGNLADALADRLGAARRRVNRGPAQAVVLADEDVTDVTPTPPAATIDPAPAPAATEAQPVRDASLRPERHTAGHADDPAPDLW